LHCTSPTSDPCRDDDRSRGAPDGCGAGHGRQADRRFVRQGTQYDAPSLRRQHRRRGSANAHVSRDNRGARGGQANERDAFEAVDEAVGWAKLLRVRGEAEDLAKLANEDPLLRAADRWRTLRRFAPDLIEALEFCAVRAGDSVLGPLQLLAELNWSGKREVPADAPMPFRKEWQGLVTENGAPNRRLYEMAVLATARQAALG
jgi:hypothetical protein